MDTPIEHTDTHIAHKDTPISQINWSQSFNATTALANMYLWLLFGYLATQINCDLQRLMFNSVIVRHLVSLLAFFFLFTLIDSTNKSNLITTWTKTLVVYGLFILTTKSKWFFIVPVLILLLIDQSIKKYEQNVKDQSAKIRIEKISKCINFLVIVIIVIGAIDYYFRQKQEYKRNFSFVKFLFGTNKACKKSMTQLHV